MANIHAYKTVYALKEIAEDLLYTPENIISDESSAEVVVKEGFKILLQTQADPAEIRAIVSEGYSVEKVDVAECSPEEYLRGFSGSDADVQIDLDSSVEAIEARTQGGAKQGEKAKIAPGDFVIKSKEPGKQRKLAKDKPKAEKAAFISVNVSKMNQLMELIGELVISESVVLQSSDLKVPGLNLDNFNKAAAQLAKISTDLQNVIMSMRMVPLTNTFQKMNRIVFDVWITVQDNGTGLDREKILAKARKQGILDDARPDSSYSDKEVYQFITLPGFSTNEQVTEYSGRGVGMDVVVRNIQEIGGMLDIESDPGNGSTMSLKIPLTLAIIDGIVMETGGSSFVMESGVIKEFVRVREDMMIHEPNGDEYIMMV